MILHGIPNCDTVKRARAWLTERGVAHEFHDFKRQGVPAQALERWIDTLGHERLLNRQGTTWRKLDDATKADAGEAAGARALMLAQPSVIRRPVVQWPDGVITAGFDVDEWATRLG
jgi:Spx/MgsR family transcriptional regulator